LFGEGESFALRAVEDGIAARFVFEATRVMSMGPDTDTLLGDFAVNVLTAAPPLPRGKKKPFQVIGG
jgi:hypothetical protein